MMLKTLTSCSFAVLLGAAGVTSACAHDANSVAQAPPEAPYQKVSELVALPDFIPGLGQLFVDPATLPAGPFLAYDRSGELVHMIPIADLNPTRLRPWRAWQFRRPRGHPLQRRSSGGQGPMPAILWHVSAEQQAGLSQ